ncbi:MAG TPA: NAD(P)/FAD-dependent oxidoreductase [Umezawaea sp.]|nr:NAD(P)/FAD-dependent oxidoreductase [Umezawaea sp.]
MTTSPVETEHLDVLIIGAGISGIGAAYYLQRDHPDRDYAILEARAATGGTWDLFRYPGIRSDSDLHTFGYEFKPWRDERAIAGADKILDYLRETASEHGIDRKVRFRHHVLDVTWSSSDARWTVEVERTDVGDVVTFTATWLFFATGYYRYDKGFSPDLPGRENFAGPVVHPQHWPEDLDCAGKRVVVIGSGATAVTVVPALAATAAHVTMLQRTPSYILPVPSKDVVGNRLRALLGEERAYRVIRRKNIAQQRAIWWLCQRFPRQARAVIRRINAKLLPAGYPVDEHFNPPYGPWDQRLCVAPDGDLFKVIRAGDASVVTDRIAGFTESGVLLESGRELGADVVVTATGLNVRPFGGIAVTVDDVPVRLADTVAYKGMMLSGVPNLAFAVGYTASSWTLKVGLLCEYFCRLLAHMDAHGYEVCVPAVPDATMAKRPFLDLASGYIQRALDQLPSQGDRKPWLTSMDYHADVKLLRRSPVQDADLAFSRVTGSGAGRAARPRPSTRER